MPEVADCTFTVMAQLAPEASVLAPDRAKVPGLVAVALAVAAPPQLLVVVVLVLTRPDGYVSVNAKPVIVAPVTLVNVIVMSVAVLAPSVVAAKLLVTCGLAICKVAAAAAVFVPPLVVSAPAGIVLPYAPPVGALTLTVIVQTLFAGMLPPTSLISVLPTARAAPAVSVNAPPQLFVTVVLNRVMLPGAPAPVFGKKSEKVTPVNAAAVGLASVIDKLETAFGATKPGVKDLLTDGAGVTVSDWMPAVLTPALLLDTAPAGMVLV